MVLFVTLLVLLLEAVYSLERKHVVDSQPLHFVEGPETEHHVINSTIILKKKPYTIGPVFYNGKKPEEIVNNHHISSPWKRPPLAMVYSNHKDHKGEYSNWKQKWNYYDTTTPPYDDFQMQVELINNHKSGSDRYQTPSSIVKIVPPTKQTIIDVLGDRVKYPDTIKSSAVRVLDAPSHLKTTIKHNKIIVIQKRVDKWNESDNPINSVQQQIHDYKGNFSVAPVMDPWSSIPIPSSPSWAPNKVPSSPVKGEPSSGSASSPIKGAAFPAGSVVSPQTVLPNLPFMPFFSSLFAPLLSKPLSASALNSGMQGIKAMQGFLRNSLLGAMFCFLPSAFIALTLTATQRTELRSSPEMEDLMIFCKKCLENLQEAKSVAEYMENNELPDDSR